MGEFERVVLACEQILDGEKRVNESASLVESSDGRIAEFQFW
jgi:hypothetical protein